MNLKAFYPNIKDKEAEKINRTIYVGESINEPSSLINPDDICYTFNLCKREYQNGKILQ